MKQIIYGLVLATAVGLFTTAQSTNGAPPPVPWQITIKGRDRGVMFLTFLTDTPPTNHATGYGVSLDALGPFTLTGTWDLNPQGDIACGFIQTTDAGSRAGSFIGKTVGNGGFLARVIIPHSGQKFTAPAPGPVPDLSGSWAGSAASNNKKTLESFTLTPSTNNLPGWFDITNGIGIGDSGTFAISGAVIVTTDHNAAGYTLSNFGTATLQASFVGRLSHKSNKLVLHGQDENSQNVTVRIEKPTTK